MDAKEIELRGKSIVKAISDNEPSSSLLKLLGDLKTGVKATEDLLRSTRIGITVNRLRTHKDPAVAKAAQELVGKWKNEVKAKGGAARPRATNGTASPAPASGTASPAPAKRKHDVAPEKRNHKTDKVDYELTDDPARNQCIRLMYDGLALMTDELPNDIIVIAKEVEAAAFATNGATNNEVYRQKMRSLFQNLKNKSNPGLRKRVLSGDVSPKRFVTMSADELKSAERRAEDARLEKENMNNAMAGIIEKSISTEFQCGKCKQKKVSYSQAQTRSADEPMTTFCECMNCGNRWKFS